MPVDLFLSVPQMWKSPANLTMAVAGEAAGADYVELVYEPQCAAAYYLQQNRGYARQPNVSGTMLIADIGGGTGDFVSYGNVNSGEGVRVQLSTVGKAHGLCIILVTARILSLY